jgi:DNA-binding LacI/PurR family transcriptional regulator
MTTTTLTIRQIADQTGVSTATVSRVLNNRPGISDKARDAVLRAVNEAGYRGRTNASASVLQIGLVYAVSSETAPLRGYEADLAAGVYSSLADQQAQMAILHLADKRPDETFTQFFHRKHVDGVVLRVSSASRAIAGQITEEGFPCVVASDRFDNGSIGYVDYDSRVGMARAMDYLAELGHRRVSLAIHVHGEDTDHRDRMQAYKEGLSRNGLDFDPALVIPTISSREGGASVIDQCMTMANPPTAIVFTNPPPTIGAIKRALQRGLKVPDDLSIVGYDNADLRHSVFPAFSAVCQDAERIGRLAASSLMDRLQDRSVAPVQTVVPTLFEANETTGAPRKSFKAADGLSGM